MRDERLHVVTRLRARGGARGTLVFGLSLATLKQEQKTNLLVVGGASACLLLVGLAFAVLVSTYLSRRRRAEAALRRSEASFRGLIESLPDAIGLLRGGKLSYASPRTTRYLGLGGDDLLERSILDFVHPDDRVALEEVLERMDRPGEVKVLDELRFVRSEGEIVQAEVTVLSLVFDGEVSTVLILRDLTERQQCRRGSCCPTGWPRWGPSRPAWRTRSTTRWPTSSRTSPTPSSRSGDAGRLRRTSDAVLAEMLQALREALEGAERVSNIVRGLKTFSRSDEDPLPPDAKRVLESAINLAFNEIRHRARLQKDYRAVPAVVADDSRLGQVFLNLLVNAVHAIRPTARRTTRSASEPDPGGRPGRHRDPDTGCGIAPEVLGRISTPSSRPGRWATGPASASRFATGLVASLGGTITWRASWARGASFAWSSPRRPGSASTTPRRRRGIGAGEPARSDADDRRRAEVETMIQRVLADKHACHGGERQERRSR